LRALRTGRCDDDIRVGLWAIRNGRTTTVAGRNREPGARLDVEVVVTLWREYASVLLADHIERWPCSRPVPWWWWDQEVVRITPGTPVEMIEARIGDQGSWLLDNGLLEPGEVE